MQLQAATRCRAIGSTLAGKRSKIRGDLDCRKGKRTSPRRKEKVAYRRYHFRPLRLTGEDEKTSVETYLAESLPAICPDLYDGFSPAPSLMPLDYQGAVCMHTSISRQMQVE